MYKPGKSKELRPTKWSHDRQKITSRGQVANLLDEWHLPLNSEAFAVFVKESKC